MNKLAKHLSNPTARLLDGALLVVAGTFAASLTGHGGEATTGAALLAGTLREIFVHWFATESHHHVAPHDDHHPAHIVNHDLTLAVGRTVAAILTTVADGIEDSRREIVARLAECAEEHWLNVAGTRTRLLEGGPGELGITEMRLREIIEAGSAGEPVLTLSALDWIEILNELATQATARPGRLARLLRKAPATTGAAPLAPNVAMLCARALCEKFAAQFRETLKADAASGGKAYPAMQIALFSELLARLAAADANRAYDTGILKSLMRDALRRIDELRAGLSEAQRIDLQPILVRSDGISAQIVSLRAMVEQGQAAIVQQIRVLQESIVLPAPHGAPLPVPDPGPCLGRETELETLVQQLLAQNARPIRVLGMGGYGKTTLALAALRSPRVVEQFGPRRYLVECAALPGASDVMLHAAAAMGLPASTQPLNAVCGELMLGPAAICLDNLETALDADGHGTASLLRQLAGIPGVVVAITARGDRGPGNLAWAEAVTATSLPSAAAREAFAKICPVPKPQIAALDALLEEVGRIALAVTLLARQARTLGDLPMLIRAFHASGIAGRRDGVHRTDSLDRCFAFSLENNPRVDPSCLQLLDILAWLPAGIAVGDLDALGPPGAVESAVTLVEVGLALRREVRVDMPQPLRQYLLRTGTPDYSGRHKVAAVLLERAREEGPKVGEAEGGAEALARLSAEWTNLLHVISVELANGGWYPAAEAAFRLTATARLTGADLCPTLGKASATAAAHGDARTSALVLGATADILQARGRLEEALRTLREDAIPAFERLGDVRSLAVTKGQVADILQARGRLEEALRIRREEEIPVYERLGDVRSLAVTKGQVADILQARGDLEEALRIRRKEQIPVYERLGDVRSLAVARGKVADILQARGDLEEALRTLREDAIPAFERLGDVRSLAVARGNVADILQARGDLEEALRTLREDAIPAFERLGDVRSLAVARGKVADILQARGDLEEALRTLREDAIPAFERLGDVRELAVARTNLAVALMKRDQKAHLPEIRRLLELALEAARGMRIPEAAQIESLIGMVDGGKPRNPTS